MMVVGSGQKGSSRMCSLHHAIFRGHFIVCTLLGLFGHVGDFFQVPKCSLQSSILSRTPDTSDSEGIPGVRESQLLYILLHCLFPQGVDL